MAQPKVGRRICEKVKQEIKAETKTFLYHVHSSDYTVSNGNTSKALKCDWRS